MTVDELVAELSRPIYVFRMARAQVPYSDKLRKSAQTRLENSRLEIDEIVQRYVKSNQSIHTFSKTL